MRERQKANDVFAQQQRLLSPPARFTQAFPTVKSVIVDVEEREIGEEPRRRRFTEHDLSEYVNCSNRLCYNGGVDVGDVLRRAVEKRETEFTFSRACQGYEGSPKGRRRYRECMHRFVVTARVEYREAA